MMLNRPFLKMPEYFVSQLKEVEGKDMIKVLKDLRIAITNGSVEYDKCIILSAN
jgi:hypothetical protein